MGRVVGIGEKENPFAAQRIVPGHLGFQSVLFPGGMGQFETELLENLLDESGAVDSFFDDAIETIGRIEEV